mgnify:CR=1 FL=1
MTGVEMIAAERERQQYEEGWLSEHDDEHSSGELAFAAAAYAIYAATPMFKREWERSKVPGLWPWLGTWWKPAAGNSSEDRIRELTKAGALIAAEIDRLQRLEREPG